MRTRLRHWLGGVRIARQHRARTRGLRWKGCPPSSEPRLDAAGVQVGDVLYVFGGFAAADRVVEYLDRWDLRRNHWLPRLPLPAAMAHSHVAMTSGRQRFIYSMSGQVGPWCSPATPAGFVFDTVEQNWSPLPPLPSPRYAATMQLWHGRLHIVGGSLPDRVTPAAEHWSLPVAETAALENGWREEPPIPTGGPHRASAILHDRLYVFGGQTGDFAPIAGSPEFVCRPDPPESFHGETWSIDLESRAWRREADLPVPTSHTEFSQIVIGNTVTLAGGTIHKTPDTHLHELTDVLQQFDADTGTWSICGTLPYRCKTPVLGLLDGWLYAVGGQRDRGPHSACAGPITNRAWKCRWPAT